MTRIYSAGASVKGLIVDSTGSALVRATSQTRSQEAAVAGDSFNIGSGIINLTTANESALIYYKHFEAQELVIDSLIIGIENNGTDVNNTALVKVKSNATAGTIVSTATAAPIRYNRNFGEVSALDNSIIYAGAEGHTITDGTDWGYLYANSGRNVIPLDIVLNRGNSFGVTLDLQANSLTDIDVYVLLVCHLKHGD